MYKNFYKLDTDPFCLSPDHRFCYRHRSFSKARAYLYFALQRAEGFVMITGAPGSGKTTLLNQLVSEANTARFTIARLNTTQLRADDLLQMAAYAFRLSREGRTKAQLLHQMEIFLQQQQRADRRSVLIVDEAQDLSVDALEEVRLLTNLELDGRPLLQVFLVGQEQLQEKLSTPELVQLQQRMIAHAHLEPMNASESAAYIEHRLRVSGWSGDPQFSDAAVEEIFLFSHGVPRRVNQICSRLFLYGMVEEKHRLDVHDVQHVIGELHAERLLPEEDADLFTVRVDPETLAQLQTARRESPRELQSNSAFLESAQNVQKRSEPLTHISDASAERVPNSGAAALRTEVTQIVAKFAPNTASAKNTGSLGMAVAHKLEEPSVRPDALPAARRAAQIHELPPARRLATRPDAADAAPEPELPTINSVQQRESTTPAHLDYQRQTQRQWGYVLLLAAGMLAAALYTVKLDMTATPPVASSVPRTEGAPLALPHIDIPAAETLALGVKSLSPTQQLGEQLLQRGIVAEASGNGFLINPGDDATFAFRSVVITDSLRETLDRIIAVVAESPATMIRVTGHADASGSTDVNMDISRDRADNVVRYFARHGVPSSRLQTQARGSEQLKSTSKPSLNRRVEIYVEPAIPLPD